MQGIIPNGGHEIVSTINVGFQSLFSFHKSIELPSSYCNFHFYSFNGKFKKKIVILITMKFTKFDNI
jgi:hypothetical protein